MPIKKGMEKEAQIQSVRGFEDAGRGVSKEVNEKKVNMLTAMLTGRQKGREKWEKKKKAGKNRSFTRPGEPNSTD